MSKIKARVAKAGTLLCVDGGAYSDYSVTGFFVVLNDFQPYKELDLFFDSNPAQRGVYNFDGDMFLAALTAKGLLLEIHYATLHVGGCRSAEEFLFTPVAE